MSRAIGYLRLAGYIAVMGAATVALRIVLGPVREEERP